MAWFISAFPSFGQASIVQTLEDGSTIFPVLGNNLVQLDSLGRLEGVLNSRGGLTTFTFDDAGNLFSRKDAKNAETLYEYDSLNRLVSITNESVEVATFDYDPNGNVISHRGTENTEVSFGYDEMNRLVASTSSVASVASVVENQFDLNGNRTNIVYPGGLTVGYEFGADNRLKTVQIFVSSAPLREIDFSYDTANRLTGISYPNGVNSTFGHDAESRVTAIQHGTFVDRTIIRNALGFKTTELIDAGIKPTVRETRRSIKTHNDADQLVSEQVQRGTNWTDVSYSYSANGCLTNISPSVQSAESVDYTYDYDNRLSSATSASSVVNYLYDATGARIGRISGTTTNYFVVDYTDGLKRPLAETDASGTITRFYVWSGSQLLCHIDTVAGGGDPGGSVYYYHSDELGSTLALTAETGTVTDQFAYMPYGYATHTGSTETPFQWLGGYGVYYDADTDLHLTLYRAYSSKMKRFIHPDPLGIDGGVNVYMWANMNPLAFVDPYGLCAESGMSGLDKTQIALDGAGLFPGLGIFPDAANTIISLGRGNWGEAGLNALAMIPALGQVATAAKYADEAVALAKYLPAPKTTAFNRPPASLMDDMTLNAAKQGKGVKIIDNLGDPKFKGMEKWSYSEKSATGLRSEVHYVRDPNTGKLLDFKFKHSAETYR